MNTNKKWVFHIKKNIIGPEEIASILFFSGYSTTFIINAFLGFLGLIFLSTYAAIALNCLTAICIFAGLLRTDNYLRNRSIVLIVVVVFVISFNYLLHPGIGEWLTHETYGLKSVFGLNGHIFTAGVMGFMVVIIQKDANRLFKSLKICNVLLILYLLVLTYIRLTRGYFMIEGESGLIQRSYNMSYGYYAAFVSTLNYTFWRNSKKKFYLALSILFAALALLFGSRGIIITFGLFVISIIWVSLRETKFARRLLTIALIALATVVIANYYTEIMFGIDQFFRKIGLSGSRTISGLISRDILEANGRDRLWSLAASMIKEKFPFGYGAFGEREIIGSYLRWGYVHNIFLELIIEFGIIGLIILIFTFFRFAICINSNCDEKWNALFILFFSNCGMLLVSNSFWYHPYFWATIGIGMLYSQKIKNQKRSV